MRCARAQPGIEWVGDRTSACETFELPFDREGDVVVISDVDTAIGAARRDHDLTGLAGLRLRTHGGIAEARVPLILNRPAADRAGEPGLRSHDIFELALAAAA